MEKNTILAIALSSFVLIISFVVQGIFTTQQQFEQPSAPQHLAVPPFDHDIFAEQQAMGLPPAPPQFAGETGISQFAPADGLPFPDGPEPEPLLVPLIIDTGVASIELTNAGGEIVSFRWRDERRRPEDPNRYVDLILSGTEQARAFAIAFGDHETAPVSVNFHVNRRSDHEVEFYRHFIMPASLHGAGGRFRLSKIYSFTPGEFLFELTVSLYADFAVLPFNFAGGNAYTLIFGPQIGPPFERLDRFVDFRHHQTFTNNRLRDARVNELIESPAWAAISGRYFVFIARPLLPRNLRFSDRAEPGIPDASRLYIHRPAETNARISDTYRFYLGPKTNRVLSIYNHPGNNVRGITEADFSAVASARGFWSIFSPLEWLLKLLLDGIYAVVRNYGIAIILLTMLIKVLFFPLTKKGSEATLRMQALAPKMKELQEKYKNNKHKLNTEMANFYKQEGYNPLAGCLPMLLQMPIFITMYQLFMNDFDLRGAMFIPGWIPDLSLPEYLVSFGDFSVPILGWTALRGLPFIYIFSQLMYGKVTQMPGQQSATQMKLMLFIMPIVFFFILYDVPSGLLVYWIFSNVLTLVQQVIINKYVKKKRAAAAAVSVSTTASASTSPEENKQKKTYSANNPGKKKKRKK